MHSHTKTRFLQLTTAVAITAAVSVQNASYAGETPEFRIQTPDTTGMPGQGAVMYARFGPEGNLWVGSNTSGQIWQFGGIGIYNGDTWTTYSSRNTELPMWTYAVDWDSQGNAWIAGEDRLLKFDGESFEVFDAGNSPLVGDRNWDVAVDANDHIWVANDDIDQVQGGLFEYDGTSWTHHNEPFMQTYFGDSIPFGVYVRSNGEVWAIFQFMGGCAKYANGTWTRQTGPQILGFAEASDGTLYGVNGLGTYKYDDLSASWTQIGPYTSIAIAVDAQDRIYVGENDATYRYENETWSFFAASPSDVNTIEFDSSGDVWISYDHSVRQHDSNGNGKHIFSSVITGVPDYILDNIERDRDGNLWLANGLAGVTRFDGTHYRNFSRYGHEEVNPFNTPSGLVCTHVDDVYQDSQGNFWFAANGIAKSADLENWQTWYYDNSNVWSGGVTAIGEDINGTIWAGTNGAGIYWYNGSDWQLRQLSLSYNGNRVRDIVSTPDGVMWVATYMGLHRYDGVEWTYIDGSTAFLPGRPRDISLGVDGDLWVATTQGLSHYNGKTWFVYGPHNAPFMHPNISCVAVRDDGLVAACSEDLHNYPYTGDLCLFDGTSWQQYPGGYDNPNPFYQSHAMEFDRDGDLWIAQVNFGAVEVMIGGPVVTPGDVDGNGVVDVFDLLDLLSAWGPCAVPNDCPADLDGNGTVDVFDLLELLANWG